MALETGTYISDLVATNPVGSTDTKSTLDDHIRLLKSTILATFPNIDGAVTPSPADLNVLLGADGNGLTPTELSYVNGVTSAIQTQLDALSTGKLSTSTLITNVSVSNYVIPKYIAGLNTSNGTDTDHDIDITTGAAMDSTDAALMILSSALTKQIDASWAAGTNAGGFPTGLTLSNSTWYHVFIIGKADGTVDAGFDTSLTATNLLADATGYTYYRRIGSVLTNGTANIIAYSQVGDYFEWGTHVEDYSGLDTAWPTTPTLQALTVPTGVKVMARIRVLYEAGFWQIKLSSPETSDHAASATDFTHEYNTSATALDLITNTSAQIYLDTAGSTGGTQTYTIMTSGWRDFRGQS